MSQGNEIEEMGARASGAVVAMISAATQLAMALIELRIQQLREAAQRDQDAARIARERARVYQQADAAKWRAAMRPQWWRQASAEDVSGAWRAASTWQHVDPRAAEARQVIIERLAERGVRIDPGAVGQPSPEDVAWLSDALDQAAAERAARSAAEPRAEQRSGPGQDGPTIIDGETADPAERPLSRLEREQRAAEHVRSTWSAERAERVLECQAWPVLAHQLGQLEDQGHDVEALLAGVPAFVDRAHTPAAFAFRSIEDRLDGLVDLGTQGGGGSEAGRTADRSRDAADLLAEEVMRTPAQTMGERLAGGATLDQVRAAGVAYWGEQHLAAKAESAVDQIGVRDANGYNAADRALIAVGRMDAYRRGDMSPYERLAAELPDDQQAIVAQLSSVDGGVSSASPAVGVGSQLGVVAEAGERSDGDHQAASQRAAATSVEAQLAEAAAQAFPKTTSDAVAAAVEQGEVRRTVSSSSSAKAVQPALESASR